MLAVLLHAREVLSAYGWLRGEYPVDRHGVPKEASPNDGYTLVDAINTWPVTAARWEARLLLQHFADRLSLSAWNAFPYRQARDVEVLLDLAIRELGGTPPDTRIRERRETAHRGGWTVSTNRRRQ